MSRARTIDAYVRRISTKLFGSLQHAQDEWPPRILNIRGLGYQLSVRQVTAAYSARRNSQRSDASMPIA